jgi:hypothetical protein
LLVHVSMISEYGSLWVRYLGGTVVHCAEVFPIPTDQVPAMVRALQDRGDVAEVWYLAEPGADFDVDRAHKAWPITGRRST